MMFYLKHRCPEWDYGLIGPGMSEWEACSCGDVLNFGRINNALKSIGEGIMAALIYEACWDGFVEMKFTPLFHTDVGDRRFYVAQPYDGVSHA